MSDFICSSLILVAVGIIVGTFYFTKPVPDNFDSMLCSNHAAVGAKLVTDELIACTNGKRYRSVGNE